MLNPHLFSGVPIIERTDDNGKQKSRASGMSPSENVSGESLEGLGSKNTPKAKKYCIIYGKKFADSKNYSTFAPQSRNKGCKVY
jgi:hypothetical protein